MKENIYLFKQTLAYINYSEIKKKYFYSLKRQIFGKILLIRVSIIIYSTNLREK